MIKLRSDARVLGFDFKSLLGFWAPDIELHDDEWHREPNVQVQQARIGEVYESAPAPRWTRDYPTHPGLWLVRVPGYPRRVVEVYFRADDPLHMNGLYFSWTDIPEEPVRAERTEPLDWSDRAYPEPLER